MCLSKFHQLYMQTYMQTIESLDFLLFLKESWVLFWKTVNFPVDMLSLSWLDFESCQDKSKEYFILGLEVHHP